ncbi:unnamed protein product [Laminaria digitata]
MQAGNWRTPTSWFKLNAPIFVACSEWTMIPAENLVSVATGTPTKIAVKLTEPSQVQGAAFALQIGVDALLLGPDNDLWNAAVAAREDRNDTVKQSKLSPATDTSSGNSAQSGYEKKNVELSTGVVTRTKEGGVGDRVCVDLIQSLAEGEGMLVGSSAKMLALVHAETFETGFVPARRVTCTSTLPFRINAGPVHAYALLADGSTKYLSELCAGDQARFPVSFVACWLQVLVVNWSGESRAVAIGRLKVETRPMIMVEFQGEGARTGQLFLQQAETVKLISPTTTPSGDALEPGTSAATTRGGAAPETSATVDGWFPLSVTDVEGGELVLLREISRGTHVGRAIDAFVTES